MIYHQTKKERAALQTIKNALIIAQFKSDQLLNEVLDLAKHLEGTEPPANLARYKLEQSVRTLHDNW